SHKENSPSQDGWSLRSQGDRGWHRGCRSRNRCDDRQGTRVTAAIHPTAIVSDHATLGENVSIGPYCIVGADVTLGDGVRLVSHVSVDGRPAIGARTTVYPFSSIGHPPQDLKFEGE